MKCGSPFVGYLKCSAECKMDMDTNFSHSHLTVSSHTVFFYVTAIFATIVKGRFTVFFIKSILMQYSHPCTIYLNELLDSIVFAPAHTSTKAISKKLTIHKD